MKCEICEKLCAGLQGLVTHLRMQHKVKYIDYALTYKNFEIPKCYCGENCKLRNGNSFYKSCCKSECKKISLHLGQQKAIPKQRESRLEWLKKNPEKTAWRLGNVQSWPEKFFEAACVRAELDKKFVIVREFLVFPFFIDFTFTQIKVAVEIDGSQHMQTDRKARDAEKDKMLETSGWRILRIPATMLYAPEDGDTVIQKLLEFIGSIEARTEVGFRTAKQHRHDAKITELKIRNENSAAVFNEMVRKIMLIDFSVWGWTNIAGEIIGVKAGCVRRWMRINMTDFYNNIKLSIKGTHK